MKSKAIFAIVAVLPFMVVGSGSLSAQEPGPRRQNVSIVPLGTLESLVAIYSKGLAGASTVDLKHLKHSNCKTDTCSVTVRVLVDASDPAKCAFEFDPYVLVTKKKKVTITWTLEEPFSPKHAKFKSGKGVDIYQDANDFINRQELTDKKQSWDRDKDLPAGEAKAYFYDVYVAHDGGDCDVPDPIIVNRD